MAYSVPDTHQLKSQVILQGLQASSATEQHPVGYTVESDDGRVFQYVYMESSDVSMYCGRPMVWVDTTADYVVTPDISDGVVGESNNAFCGVATMNNIDVNNAYVWMQIKGLVDSALVSTTIAALDPLILNLDDDCFEDGDSLNDSVNDSSFRVVGMALTAAAAGVTSLHSTASIMLF